MKLSAVTLLTLLCAGTASASKKSSHWGPPRPAVSEYKTYSNARVKVYNKDDQLISSTDNGAECHYANITAIITAFGRTFVLRLHKNKYLFASSYVERLMSNTEQTYKQPSNMNADHCFYIGKVDGHPESTASACTCYGFLGEFTVDNETYSVEPVEKTLKGRHRVYRESDSIAPSHKCGNTAGANGPGNIPRKIDRKKRELTWPQDLDGEARFVELYIVNDFAQYTAMDSDSAKTINRAKTLVNAASALYHTESIYLVLVGVEVWTSNDLIAINGSAKEESLDNFAAYRHRHINPYHNNDNAHLITGVDFADVIGLAYIDGMCNYEKSCAFTMDFHMMPAGPAATIAHEIGHNLGFEHDDEIGSCACDDPTQVCIMESSIGDPPQTRWSQCSKDQLQVSFNNELDYCLHNVPQTVYDDTPDCGNGIVEQGEECDCGNAPASQCNPVCCVSCRLTTTATCAYGRCCDVSTCQLKSAYTECRAAKGTCDLPEYCSGTDPLCPSDVYRRNTDSCSINSMAAYCYNGECRTHQSQCRLWWGSSAAKSVDDCYTTFNVKGEFAGNCGYNLTSETTTYYPCSSSNALCGSLQCDTSAISFLQRVNFQVSRQSIALGRIGSHHCTATSYISFYNGPNRSDPGFVPDGAECGLGKMCLTQQCVDVSSVSTSDCGNCSLQGVCNTLGQCHCEIGFTPPDCSQPGGGGSLHSNAASPYPIPTVPTSTTDDLTIAGIIIGAIAGTIIISAIIGVIIWRVTSTSSSQTTSQRQRPMSSSAAPAFVSSRPGAGDRFAPSQLYRHQGYGGYLNNGYHDDEYSVRRNHHYPYNYRSRIDIHSEQISPF